MIQENTKTNADKLKEEFYKGVAELRELINTLTAKTDKEIDKLLEEQKKTDEQMKETDRKIDRLRERQEKTDEQMKETDRKIDKLRERQEKTDEQIAKTDTQIAKTMEGIAELRESQKKTDEQFKKTDKEIEKVNKMVGKLTDSWGKFVEGLVEPNVAERFEKFGIKIIRTYQRPVSHRDGETMELDILAVGRENNRKDENLVMVVEASSSLTIKEVKETEKKLVNFFKFFNEYRGKKLIGVVAGVRLSKGVKDYAEKNGLYILAPKGDTMEILNKPDFKPKVWK